MADLQERFEVAAREAQQLARRPDNTTLLRLYALYKQSTVGDVTGKRSGAFDIAGRAKHEAWARLAGMGRDEAMQGYIDLVDNLKSGAAQ